MVMVISSLTIARSAIHAEILAVDGCAGGCAHVNVPSRVFDRGGRTVDVEHHFLGHAMNRQVAGDFQLARTGRLCLFRFETNCGIFLDIQEIWTAQVIVPHVHARVDGGCVNRRIQRSFAGVGRS